jgi:hypothetical protein
MTDKVQLDPNAFITRTLRFTAAMYHKISEKAEQQERSFNWIVI